VRSIRVIFRLGFGLVLSLAVLTVASSATAQEAVNFASVSGRVFDPMGAPVSGASVVARHVATNVVTSATTDPAGRFRFPYLRAGAYEFIVEARNFARVVRTLTLSVGSAFDLPVALVAGAAETAVTVTADATMLEASRSQIAVTVAQAEVKALPLNGRNFLDIALLVPGVSPTNVGGGTQLFAETSAVPGVGLSVSSQRNLSNNFMVDGLSANDDAAALSGISFSVDAVDQFQVVTSGGQAELGRALGGHINIATRSGTNQWRSDMYAYFRDDRFNGENALSGTKLPMHQNQFGGSLGGPIARSRTFFFANVEHRALDQSGLVTIPAGTVAIINTRLAAVGYGGPAVTTGVYSNPVDTTHFLGKVDHHFSGRDQFSLKYSSYDVTSANARGAGGTSAPSASAGLDNLDQAVAAGNVLVLNSRTVLETRGQFARGDLEAPPTDLIGPAVSIAGVAAFGRLSSSPTARLNSTFQVVNNLVHQAGDHAVRAGVDFLYHDDTITFPRAVKGSYAFGSLSSFLSGVYNNAGFTQTFGDTMVGQTNANVGTFVQDEWRMGSRVTLNTGLRYELQYLETIETDTNNVSPRAGVTWSPLESRRTLVRASAGRFYDRVPLRAVANALLSANNTTDLAGLRQIGVSLSPGQTSAPAFPAILPGIVPTTTLVNLTTMDRHLQNAHSNQVGIEVEQQLTPTSVVSLGYQHLRSGGLIMQINQNVPSCAVSGSNNGCRPNPAYANNNQYSAAGRAVYDGLQLSFVQRPVKWGSLRVSYTYSKSMNNVGETFFASPIDPTDVEKDWGRSDDDQRHRLVVTGSVMTSSAAATNLWETLTHGFQVSGMVQYYSALPFNIITGTNTIQGTAARPTVNGAFIPRNSGEGSSFSTVSIRLARTFVLGSRASVDALVEAFNLFDRRNDLARNTVFGTGTYPTNPAPNFGQVTVVGDPRSLQFGLRFRY
jgi:hypothetical protein